MARDVIVIGAGGGGPVVAKELAERGLDVLVLEGGPRFARSSREMRHLEYDANDPVSGYLRVGPADRSRPPWMRDLPQSSFVWQSTGVGGTTLHYFANSPRAMPGVFRGYRGRDRNAYDRAHEFPFSYRSLIPYYEWVEHTLPVQTAAMGTKERVYLRAAARSGLPVQAGKDIKRNSHRPQENAILQPRGTAGRTSDPRKLRFPKARGCTFCGFCLQGCYEPLRSPRNLRAKRSTDNSYVPMALTADLYKRGARAATLIANAFVTRIGTAQEGARTVARTVTWRDTASGEMHTEEARVVVMAGGCVENPRLWFNSNLPNPNDWVGRGITDHYLDWVIGVLPRYTGSSRGPNSAARCDFPGRGAMENVGLPPGFQAFSGTFSDSGIAGFYDNGAPAAGVGLRGADTWGRQVGGDLLRMMDDVDRVLNVLVLTDDDVEAQNRVTLSPNAPPDEHGPVSRVEMKHRARSARTRRNREYVSRQAVRLLRAAGAERIYRMNFPPLILHIQSSMRMGANPADSVLDRNAESRFVRRLFIADNSALPNALGGPNPTLTTQALATRTAEKIFTRYFGGEPWVRRESPLSSIDDRVTAAVFRRGLADAPRSSRPRRRRRAR
ncbi:MAG TPA: GMC oxidoreductase [Thermoleophilaceae bacterium]|nr:GMC oxidoreductase [Thermoleophilaceae bacterium]